MGFTAYIKDGEGDPGTRPITFAYNGGPGSSSMWLHMGALGPRIVVTNDAGLTAPAPYKTIDNAHTILDITDLVLIDPVGTGLSHPMVKQLSRISGVWIRISNQSVSLLNNILPTTNDGILLNICWEKVMVRCDRPVFQIIFLKIWAFR